MVSIVEKRKFGKTSKVSKYYENDGLKNFIFLFMSLLSSVIVRNGHI